MNTETLKKFCYPDNMRPNLMEPFSRDGYTWASDGRIMIRVPEIPGAVGHKKAPDPWTAWLKKPLEEYIPAELPQGWQEMEVEYFECQTCQGTGQVYICPECEGEGVAKCKCCGSENDCKTCEGAFFVSAEQGGRPVRCEDCNGETCRRKRTPVRLPGSDCIIDLFYLKLVMELPGARLFRDGSHDPLCFTFDGGEGVLMPIRHL